MKTERRSVLKKLIASVAGIAGLEVIAKAAAPSNKNDHRTIEFGMQQLYPGVSIHNGLVYLSGLGYHKEPFNVTEHTNQVLAQMKERLETAGSSMDKVLKVNVYLNDILDYEAMNKAYDGHFGLVSKNKPVRTTVAVAKGGVPGNSLVEIDCIAYI